MYHDNGYTNVWAQPQRFESRFSIPFRNILPGIIIMLLLVDLDTR